MKKILLCYFLFQSAQSFAQLKNDSLEYRIRPDARRSGELYFSLNNFNYLRNYEFFNKFQDGYTLYGTQLEPQLVYYANPNLSLQAGVHLRKDFGGKGIGKTYPLFSIKYQQGNTALITGALEATTHHRFIEPIYDVEKRITEPVAYGTQVVINKPSFYFDGFVNWKKMIYKPSPEQEQIVAGASSDIRLSTSKKVAFSVPIQLTIFHQGGQIDTVNKPLQTILNGAAGFKLVVSSSREGFIHTFRTENYVVLYKEMSPTKVNAFANGSGIYLNAGADTRLGSLIASYWHGDGFISSNGMPIYQSVSQQIDNDGYSEKKRSLLFIRYAYQKQLAGNFWFDFRVEPVMDLKAASKKVEFYHSLFLVYKQDFRIGKVK